MNLFQQIQQLFSRHPPVSQEVHDKIATMLSDAKELSSNLLETAQTLHGLVESSRKREDRREAARERLEQRKGKGWPT